MKIQEKWAKWSSWTNFGKLQKRAPNFGNFRKGPKTFQKLHFDPSRRCSLCCSAPAAPHTGFRPIFGQSPLQSPLQRPCSAWREISDADIWYKGRKQKKKRGLRLGFKETTIWGRFWGLEVLGLEDWRRIEIGVEDWRRLSFHLRLILPFSSFPFGFPLHLWLWILFGL